MCKGPVAEGACKAIRIKRSVWLECREQVGSRGAEVGTRGVGRETGASGCQTCSLGSRILSFSSEQEVTVTLPVGKSTTARFAFGNNYFGCSVKSRVGKGAGRTVGGVCSHPGKRGADGICQGGVH